MIRNFNRYRRRLQESKLSNIGRCRARLNDDEILACDLKNELQSAFDSAMNVLNNLDDCSVITLSNSTYRLKTPFEIYGKGFVDLNNIKYDK